MAMGRKNLTIDTRATIYGMITWAISGILGALTTAGVYKLFKKQSEPDTFVAWLFRDGFVIMCIITLIIAAILKPAGFGYSDGSDY